MADARPLDFIAIGRAAVDLYGEQIGGRLEDMSSFAKYLGGCPANISVGAARLGLKPAMLTRVGDEHMGRFVREALAAEGVDVSHVKTDPAKLTGLVILGIRDQETFPLLFYRENCADMAVSTEDFDAAFIASAKALVVTGTHFSTAHVDRTSRAAIAFARAAGTKVVLDIDYRPVLWGLTGRGLGEQRFVASDTVSAHLQSILPSCDLVVGTDEEIHIAGGSTDTLVALKRIRALSGATIVLKRGALGCTVFPAGIPDRVDDGIVGSGFPVEVFNVLGAGDAFMAGLLRGWLRGEGWERATTYANACGALVVSRHGCAPAMPSWIELSDFLARARTGLTRLHDDPRVTHLHRATTGHRAWPEVLALAFDHRKQFDELIVDTGANAARVGRFKGLITEAVRWHAGTTPGVGVVLDDRFGRDLLYDLTGSGIWIARPVELPGATPLDFEAGPDPAITLRTWPAEHAVKVLAAYTAEDPEPVRSIQEERLQRLFRACVATGHRLVLELVVPDKSAADVASRAIGRLYGIGLKPDWWKLQPFGAASDWRRIADVVRSGDPHCQGILILGQGVNLPEVGQAFAAAGGEPLVRGFAVGRSIFWAAAKAWFSGSIGDKAAVDAIASNYGAVIALWRRRTSLT